MIPVLHTEFTRTVRRARASPRAAGRIIGTQTAARVGADHHAPHDARDAGPGRHTPAAGSLPLRFRPANRGEVVDLAVSR
jgi:hypothetical protein